MKTKNEGLDHDEAIATQNEAKELRPARSYHLEFANGSLDFRSLTVSDPVLLGRQILTIGGLEPREGYSLFAILPTGDFEDIRLDEAFDLRQRGAERFVAFLTDRDFKLTLNDDQLTWGKPAIGGTALYALAQTREDQAVYLEVRGGQDRLIEMADLIDLTADGVERFVTGPKPLPCFDISVNSRLHTVHDARVTFDQIVALAFPGPRSENVIFSITFENALSRPAAGHLGPGGVVFVQDGTIFDVTRTDKS